jgi:hypothetical protein
MGNDLASFYKARMAAERSAYNSTPPVYKIADNFVYAADEFESSASLHFEQPINENDIVNLMETLSGPNEMLQNQIMQIFLSDHHIKDPMVKQAFANQKKEQVKKIIKSYSNTIEQKLRKIAEMKAFRNHEIAKTAQAQRLYGTDLAASQELSEEKNDSITEIENAYLVGPDDIAVA